LEKYLSKGEGRGMLEARKMREWVLSSER